MLLLTRVRLGTQKIENSWSVLLFRCSRWICSVKVSAHTDGIQSDDSEKESLRDKLLDKCLHLGNSSEYVE
jgi:hypothetical protein